MKRDREKVERNGTKRRDKNLKYSNTIAKESKRIVTKLLLPSRFFFFFLGFFDLSPLEDAVD